MATYDPQNSVLIIDGYRVTGFADGTFITITANEQDFTPSHGADGAAWVRNKDKGTKVSFSLRGDAVANAVLSANAKTRKLVKAPPFESSFYEIDGGTSAAVHSCQFIKSPEIQRGMELPKVDWEVEGLTADTQIGGIV